MTRPVLVLRPQPGADATAARAAALGLEAFVAPLFEIVARGWSLPDSPCDALLVTSANAARAIDARVDRTLPVYAVGAATATALFARGFGNIVEGETDMAAIVARARADGMTSLLHLAGEDRTAFGQAELRIETRIVYASVPCEPAAAMGEALGRDAVALLHSARAARRFAAIGAGARIAAISPAVLAAAGPGWSHAVSADRPTDDALLAAAARLCN